VLPSHHALPRDSLVHGHFVTFVDVHVKMKQDLHGHNKFSILHTLLVPESKTWRISGPAGTTVFRKLISIQVSNQLPVCPALSALFLKCARSCATPVFVAHILLRINLEISLVLVRVCKPELQAERVPGHSEIVGMRKTPSADTWMGRQPEEGRCPNKGAPAACFVS